MGIKQKITPQRWTTLWNTVGIRINKRGRALKKYNPKSDITSLVFVGVDRKVAEDIYGKSLKYNDELLFKKFSRLFRKDIPTVQSWLKGKTPTEAFTKLFNVLNKGDFEKTKDKLYELALVFEYYKKGEGQLYDGKTNKKADIKTLPIGKFVAKLGRNDNAKYINRGVTGIDNSYIYWITKKSDNNTTTQKFIKISKTGKNLQIVLSMDSKKEYALIRGSLEKYFGVYLDTPEVTNSLNKFKRFLQIGTSTHFLLAGVSYIDHEYRLSVAPAFNRIVNVADYSVYKDKLKQAGKGIEVISKIRLLYKSKAINKPIFLSILTYKEGILGAAILKPDAKKLSSIQKSMLNIDFEADFGVPLNQFIKNDDLNEQLLYKHFLQNSEAITNKIELRSKDALQIYTTLVNDGILETHSAVDEQSRICVNPHCENYFRRIWNSKKYCDKCGEAFIAGRSIEIRKIEERSIAKYLVKKLNKGTAVHASKKLLNRKLEVVQLNYAGKTADLILLTKPLNENQLEILKFRYPHNIILTSRNDETDLTHAGFDVINLWKLIYELRGSADKWLKDKVVSTYGNSFSKIRSLCKDSLSRISKTEFYKEKNTVVKNFGAELFEADCSSLLDYVFGNSLWLGAKHRGVSLPDGMTSFPMLNTTKGCFIWDGKFSEGKVLVMGKFGKNNTYINLAKANKSVKANGGLKGFVFISNNTFPQSFLKKYRPLTRNRKIKINFLGAKGLQTITEHYRQNENLLHSNLKAKSKFIDSMTDLFFSTVGNKKCEIISDATIEWKLKDNDTFYKTFKQGKALTV